MRSTLKTQIGLAIRKRREDLGLTLEKLSEMAGISRSYLNQIETSAKPMAVLGKYAAIANALCIRPYDLLIEDEDELSLLEMFRDLPPTDREYLLRFAEGMILINEGNKE